MLRSFEAIYRETVLVPCLADKTPVAVGQPQRFVMSAVDEAAVREVLEGQGFAVVLVTDLGAVVQFDRPVYNRDETAALLGIKPNTLTHKLGTGEIPWNEKLGGVELAVLREWIRKGYNAAGKTIVRELEQAA